MTAKLTIHCHEDGKRHDFSRYLGPLTMQKSMHGAGLGTWSAMIQAYDFEVDSQDVAVPEALLGIVRDDDWVEIDIDGRRMLGLVRSVDEAQAVQQRNGEQTRTFTIAGTDWSRCMSQSEIRMLSLFASAVRTSEILPALPFEATTDTEKPETVAITSTTPAAGFPARIPCFIDERDWYAVRAAILGATGVHTVGTGTIPEVGASKVFVAEPRANDAARALTQFLALVLRGAWRDPSGRTLISKIGRWPKVKRIPGYAWRLAQMVALPTLSPDSVLREHLNEAFTEVFYDYLDDAEGAATFDPAVVVRPKPFDHWDKLPRTVIPGSHMIGTHLTRSGAERFNFWMPDAPIAKIPGVVRLVNSDSGSMPIVDAQSVARHGIQPAEPADTMWPPMLKTKQKALLDWHQERIVRFFRWYANNHEYLTGAVNVKGSWPTARIGTVIRFPVARPVWFRVGGRAQSTKDLEAYVVGCATKQQVTPAPVGALSVVTQFQVTRVQPAGGLPTPAVPKWKIAEVKNI